VKTSTRTVLPLAWGSGNSPTDHLVGLLRVNPRRKARSTVSLNLAFGNLVQDFDCGFQRYDFLPSTTSSAFFVTFAWHLFRCGASEFLGLPLLLVTFYDYVKIFC